MLIDWTTVIFQIINFLILIALLKRFLYGPIIKAMDEREERIAQNLADAARMKEKAEEYALQLAAEQEEFSLNRRLLQQEARVEIDKWKEESIDRLKNEINDQKIQWRQNLKEEQEAFLKKLKVSISKQVFQVARKAFTDLADDKLELRLINAFLQKLHNEVGDIERQQLKQDTLFIISGFPLNHDEKDRLQRGLEVFFHGQGNVEFSEDRELGFGLRLKGGHHKWEWNLNRYMKDIEGEILKTMGMSK